MTITVDVLDDACGRRQNPTVQGTSRSLGFEIEIGLGVSDDRESDALRGGEAAAVDTYFAAVLGDRDCVEMDTWRSVGCTSRLARWVHDRLSTLTTKKESRMTTQEERMPAILDRECTIAVDHCADIPAMMRTLARECNH